MDMVPRIEILDASGPSIEAAREKLRVKAQPDQQIVCEEVLSDGSTLNLEGIAETVEEAFVACEQRVPEGASITERSVSLQPCFKDLVVRGRDEESARGIAASKMAPTTVIKGSLLIELGKKGFLGIGSTDNSYAVRIWQPAVVNITVKTLVRVRRTFQSNAADDNDRAGLIEWLTKCASWFTSNIVLTRGTTLRPYLPGQPTFICAQDKCTHTCCKFSRSHLVVVYKSFADAVKARYGVEDQNFISTWPGFHVLKTREHSKCVFVDDNNRCRVHHVRPHQCVSYPFELAFFSLRADGSLLLQNVTNVYQEAERFQQPPAVYRLGSRYDFLIPLVVYDSDCPGFTGVPISTEDYLKLAIDLFEPCRATNETVRYF